MSGEGVLRGVETAVEADPDNWELRLHYVELLLGAAQPATALQHATIVLAARPDDARALTLASRAAGEAGQTELAERYGRLAEALGGTAAPRAPASITAPAAERLPTGESVGHEGAIDAFIDEVLGADPDVEHPDVRLADVGGLDNVKKRLETSFLGPMRNADLRRMYGKSLRGGLLLYGPPGCGKTFLAKAVAGELGARFIGVGLHDVLDMWLGNSERNLHESFETARRNAPCVLFFDEVDALGMKRSNLTHSAGRGVVVQFLSELDSTRSDNEGVFVLGATNQPWDIDPALRRPGRFDRTVLVLPPDEAARVKILEVHLRDRPWDNINLRRIAEATEGYSGADLRLVCEAAAELALEDSLRTGNVRPIGSADMDHALREARPSTGGWFQVAKNYVTFANEGGDYDDLLKYMRRRRIG
ncbi:MAG TPA: AAA family ATPase [Acidimicrobiales bacterium]|nr:AAA family ATPase [Acidimicrobiales bacterium]